MSNAVLVIGASENPERYSNKAIKMLLEHHIPVFAYGQKKGSVEGVEIFTEKKILEVDTVTLYLSPSNQESIRDYVLSLNPRRVIFNPGTENAAFEKQLTDRGIHTEEACTLVLLQTNQFYNINLEIE